MDVDFDFSDVDSFFDEGEWEVEKKMIDVGDEAVKYAEEHGDYQDHTLTLRTSNDYDVNKDGLTATMVRDMILADSLPENDVVPQCVYDMRQTIKAFLNVFK